MKYQNRQPEEGINVSKHSPVKTFIQLLIATLMLVVILFLLLYVSGSWLAKRIPFKYEQAITEKIELDLGSGGLVGGKNDQITAYLNELAARIEPHLPNPYKTTYTVHYNDSSTFNAFATIGGNIVFFEGLIKELPNENALAMVMAHEMAHVAHRDPISGVGGGVAGMVALSMVIGSGNAGNIVNGAGGLTAVQFTRNMENNADDAAILAVVELYGHTAGADSLFRVIDAKRESSNAPEWFERFSSTHPLDKDRIENIENAATRLGLPTDGETTPLPDFW